MTIQNITEQVSIYKRINCYRRETKDMVSLAIGERVEDT